MTGSHRDTIMRLLCCAGEKCQEVMDTKIKGFHAKQIQVDEIWTYVGKKEKRLRLHEKFSDNGDQFVFVALDADSKLVPSFIVGKRNTQTALELLYDLKHKLNGNGRIQLTTDGFKPYLEAVENVFGSEIDFAQVVKVFASDIVGPGRYSPPRVTETISTVINGNPDPDKISTSYVERQNLTMRMQIRRFTRLTNAFSKKLENLKAALALHFAHYNFMRVHSTLRITPAMEAGLTDHVWEWEDIFSLAG